MSAERNEHGSEPLRDDRRRPVEPGPAERAALLARLASGLAHEIKNPLSTMAINLALLEEDWTRVAAGRNPGAPELTPREQRSLKRVKTLQREVERLEQIVDEFLALRARRRDQPLAHRPGGAGARAARVRRARGRGARASATTSTCRSACRW